MQSLLQDLRFSLRQLIKAPGFTITAVLSLALGIGATSAVFSVVYAALLHPFPYPTAERIFRLAARNKTGEGMWVNLNGPQFQRLRQVPLIEDALAMDFRGLTMTGHDVPENVNAVLISASAFTDLDVRPAFGRGIQPSDAFNGQDPQPVTVLSYKFWQREFNADPSVVGRMIRLDRKSYLIVGVAAPRFTWYSADVYLPLKLSPDQSLTVNILLKPGVTRAVANAALQPLIEQFAKAAPKQFPEHFKMDIQGLNDWVVRDMGSTLYLLFGAVGLLLAIGCGNVSILLLARGAARQHELALRSAIGASRRRIIRQLLTESLMLALGGAALGIATTFGILAVIKTIVSRYVFAPEVVISVNLPVLFFDIGVALATGITFGVWPALQFSRPNISQMVQSRTRSTAGSMGGRRTHQALISGQIALTLLLLAGAGAAIQNFLRIIHTPLGYDPHNVLPLWVPLHDNTYTSWAARSAYFEQLRASVASVPGVSMAAISTNATPPHNGTSTQFEMLGRPALDRQQALVSYISADYFPELRIPLLQGRAWTPAEEHNGAALAVINRTLAALYFPGGNALGHSIKVPELESAHPDQLIAKGAGSWLQVIGVVEDKKNAGLTAPVKPEIYVPYTLSLATGTQILVKSQVPPLTLVHALRTALSSVDAEQQTSGVLTGLDEGWISDEGEWQRGHLIAWIFGGFSILALALAAVGLYSVVSYTVTQRTNEFGIRIALGAQRNNVLWLMAESMLGSVGFGIVSGLVLILLLNRIVVWFEGNLDQPIISLSATFLLIVTAGVACAIPALRASRTDPIAALRCE
jgi:predicted permease